MPLASPVVEYHADRSLRLDPVPATEVAALHAEGKMSCIMATSETIREKRRQATPRLPDATRTAAGHSTTIESVSTCQPTASAHGKQGPVISSDLLAR
jgi:hypothetical protein